VVFFVPKQSSAADAPDKGFFDQVLCFSLSLAASVMITVSVISILPESLGGFLQLQPDGLALASQNQLLERMLGFASGCLAYFFISWVLLLLPEPESLFSGDSFDANSFETYSGSSTKVNGTVSGGALAASLDEESAEAERLRRASSWRMAMLIFVSLLLHNAPEGLAVAASAVESNQLGLVVTIGIMMHNIPEGIAIAVPCLVAQPDRPLLAFGLASISGLAEPIGALVALQFLQDGNGDALQLGNLLAAVAGIMIMVSIRDLYPEALRHVRSVKGTKSLSTMWTGTLCGVCIMSATEVLLTQKI